MITIADVLYFVSLLVCISLGSYYKKIEDMELKRNYGTGLGILIACIICGQHIIHSVLMVWGNIIIMKCCEKRYIQHLSLAYTWMYLIYISCSMDRTIYILWIHQTIALRLVGLAFEMSTADRSKPKPSTVKPSVQINAASSKNSKSVVTSKSSAPKIVIADISSGPSEPNAVDIIAYAYYFIGLHKGPYYRWKIFNEHFKTPFGVLGDCRIITEQKMKKAFVCGVMIMAIRIKCPVQFYYENEFYTSYGTDYRYLYNIPQLMLFVLQYQVVMMLCTSVCTEAGFGVYPTKTQPLPGHGPSARLSLLNLAAASETVALEQEYNFAMLRSFENEKLLFGPRMRDTLRGWDMSTRYWFWAHMYKGLSKSNKEVRSGLSFLAWTVWCGPSLQQLIISSTLWIHLHLENDFGEMCDTSNSMKMPWDIGFTIMRVFCLTYLTPCLILKDATVILRYYNSIFWVYHMVLFILILCAIAISKERVEYRRPNITTLNPVDTTRATN